MDLPLLTMCPHVNRLYLARHGYVQIEGPRSTFLFSGCIHALVVFGLYVRIRLVCVHILFPSGERQAGSMGQAERFNFFHVQKGV